MNQLYLLDPKLTFGEGDHPYCEAGFPVVNRRVNCLLDTGFTLGFAFSSKSIKKFGYTNGYSMSLLLGNNMPITAMVFIAELIVQIEGVNKELGQTSVVFMSKQGDPLIGIETMRLLSPIGLDWGSNEITWKW
jgi:predicted aspartyl protease